MKVFILALLLTFGFFQTALANVNDPNETAMWYYFQTINNANNKALPGFIANLPKGADLHNHLAGAPYPRWLIAYVKSDPTHPDWCVSAPNYIAKLDTDCVQHGGLLLRNVSEDSNDYTKIVEAWSMKDFVLKPPNYGHDHFFDTFERFGPLFTAYQSHVLADLMRQAAAEHLNYLELMVKSDKGSKNSAKNFGKYITSLPKDPKTPVTSKAVTAAILELEAHNFSKLVVKDTIIPNAVKLMADVRKLLQCDSDIPSTGCNVTVKFQYPADRKVGLPEVFAALYAGFKAVTLSPNNFVGINLMGPEDALISLEYYEDDMQVLKYLKQFFRNTDFPMSLHAGELTDRLPNIKNDPAAMRNHMFKAVTIAGTKRIGHGVDVFNENTYHMHALLPMMAAQKTMVEMNLTSNEEILGVCDGEAYCLPPELPYYHHPAGYIYNSPFYFYLRDYIPVTINTDDEGIEQTNLNTEYFKAVTRYKVDYLSLKRIERNSLVYSFLPGKQLWAFPTSTNFTQLVGACVADNPYSKKVLSASCQTYLDANLRAKLEWNLEKQFSQFEVVPTVITSCQSLQNISNNLSGHYILTQDIDCSATKNWNNGKGFIPIGSDDNHSFKGTFNGNHHVIKNLYINRPSLDKVGLFGDVNNPNSVISSIGLENVNITGHDGTAALVGWHVNGRIESAFATGVVNGTGSAVGGLIGQNNTIVLNSYSNVQVNGNSYAGGFVGSSYGSIFNSYSTGNVNTNGHFVGGFIGSNWANIKNCYSIGAVKANSQSGGFAGFNDTNAIIDHSYWNIQTSGKNTSAGGIGKTTEQMQQPTTYTNWDFGFTWRMRSNTSFPSFSGQ